MLVISAANGHKFIRSLPALEAEIGEKPARLLLQLDYWIRISTTKEHEGKRWTYQSTTDIKENGFPSWSASTINRVINKLISLELIVIGNFNAAKYDFTRWFALNPVGIQRLKSIELTQIDIGSNQNDLGSTQNDARSNQNGATIPVISTENSSKTSTETTNQPPPQQWVVGGRTFTDPYSEVEIGFKPTQPETKDQTADVDGSDELLQPETSPRTDTPPIAPAPPNSDVARLGEFFVDDTEDGIKYLIQKHGVVKIDATIQDVMSDPDVNYAPAVVRHRLEKAPKWLAPKRLEPGTPEYWQDYLKRHPEISH